MKQWRRALHLLCICSLVALLSGCDKVSEYVQKKINERVAAKVAETTKVLQDQIANLKNQIADLQSSISTLKAEMYVVQLTANSAHSQEAYVSPDGSGYGIVQTKQGAFVVVARSAQPYLDGYKVDLEIGNMTSATFHGAKIHVDWGPPYNEKGKTFREITAEQRKQDFNVTTVFYPGAYAQTQVVLSPAKADEVKTLGVGLTFNDMSLRKPFR